MITSQIVNRKTNIHTNEFGESWHTKKARNLNSNSRYLYDGSVIGGRSLLLFTTCRIKMLSKLLFALMKISVSAWHGCSCAFSYLKKSDTFLSSDFFPVYDSRELQNRSEIGHLRISPSIYCNDTCPECLFSR